MGAAGQVRLANFNTTTTVTVLVRHVKNRLKRMRYRHELIDGYFAAAGLPPATG